MKNKNLIRFSKLIFKKNKVQIFIALFLVIISTSIEVLTPQLTKFILDDGIGKGNINLLIKLIVIYSFVLVVGVLIELILSHLYTIMKIKVTTSLKIKLLNHLSYLSGRYFSKLKTGNILSIIENDTFIMERFNVEVIFSILTDSIVAIVATLFLLSMSKDLLIIVVIVQIIILIFQNNIRKCISDKMTNIRTSAGNISNVTQEYVSNIKEIVISKSKFKFFKGYIKREKELIKDTIDLNIIMTGNISISRVLNSIITAIIYGYGGYKVITNKLSLGELIVFQQYTNMFLGPCVNIIRTINQIIQARVSIDRVYSVIDESIDIKLDNKAYRINELPVEKLEFKNVYFDYDMEVNNHEYKDVLPNDISYMNNNILKGINMKFKRGETTAIVGGSGCGKTTIINLIYRLWDVTNGEILINENNIKNINLNTLRASINIVSQDIFLFDDTIKNNIDFKGKYSEEEILDICKIVGIDELIDKLDQGINTIIGEKGIKISGGQKQRIQLARMLTNDSEIIILDEATSALDNISQQKIIDKINSYIKNKIVIIIAHRLSTIKNADIIYVLENGSIIEYGSENELICKDGLYKRLAEVSSG